MGILFRDGTAGIGRNVVSEGNVMKGERKGGTVWEMRYDHGIGSSSSFVQENQVGDFLSLTCLDQRGDDGVSSIETVCVGKDQTQFLPHG